MENTSTNIQDTDKEHMKTMASCLNSLAAVGFETQFKMVKNGLKSLKTDKIYRPEDIKITNFYRFEGESDPSDNSILYAIETTTGERGTLIDAYGVYSDTSVTAFIKEVSEIEKRAHPTEEANQKQA